MLFIVLLLLFLIQNINTQRETSSTFDIESQADVINILGGVGNGMRGGVSANGIYFSRPNFKQRYNRNFNITNITLSSFQIIQCQNQNDYLFLLYQICALEQICNEIYYIGEDKILNSIDFSNYDSVIRLFNSREFKKFSYQLSSINFFITNDLQQNQYLYQTPTFLNLWPLSWVPPFIIQYNQTQSGFCFQSLDSLSNGSNISFIYSSLDSMKIYKLMVTNDLFCNDHNEKLMLTTNHEFKCICRNGKSCNNESNFHQLIIFLLVCAILALIVWIIEVAITSITQLKELSRINNYLNKKKL